MCVVCVHVAESPHIAVETAWEDSLSEALEKEVHDTRKIVSALQVHACKSLILVTLYFRSV